ncbi:hypothetical protein ABZ896_19735 [Streptomyces sp. NPDC047072]|uniref:hypothetical protein n=1 Tax=Streptomyces sp. NPDC047072 TaxID=3154809 RepID=UPI0033D49AFD
MAVKRLCGTAVGLAGALLLAGLTACDIQDPASDEPSKPFLTVPELYYLRPYGDRTGTPDKTPYAVRAGDKGKPGIRRLTADVAPDGRDTVRLKKSGACEGDSAHLVCEVGRDYSNWADTARAEPSVVKGARAGDTAVIRYTYTTHDGRKLTARTRFVVGEPVVEAVTPAYRKGLLRPGSELTAPFLVRNTGEVPVKGLGFAMIADGTDFEERYGNCRYPELQKGHLAVCELPDVTIEPGETVAVRPDLRLRVPKTVIYPSYGRDVWALDMGPGEHDSYSEGGDLGDGPDLTAQPADAEGQFVPGGGVTNLVVDTHADYRVSAVELRGAPGTHRTFRIEVHNDGPAATPTTTELIFDPPLGLKVLKQPMEEYDDDLYRPYCENNGYTYTCQVLGLEPGQTRTFEFTAELGDPGRGTLSLLDSPHRAPWTEGRRDPNPKNDEATIRVVP